MANWESYTALKWTTPLFLSVCIQCFQLHHPFLLILIFTPFLQTKVLFWAWGTAYGQSFQRFLNHKLDYNFQSFHIMYPREILDSNGNWPKHNFTKRLTLCTKEILLYCHLGLQKKGGAGYQDQNTRLLSQVTLIIISSPWSLAFP